MYKKLSDFFRYLTEKFCKCPFCKGEGGETDVVTDEGLGPYYKCVVCDGKGYMNIFRKIRAGFWYIQAELQDKAMMKKYRRGCKKEL